MKDTAGKYYYTISHYDKSADIVESLGFKVTGCQWYLYLVPRLSSNWRSLMEAEGLQVYYPTVKRDKIVSGRKVVREYAKIPRYAFVLGTFDAVQNLAQNSNLHPVYARKYAGELLRYDKIYATVNPDEMRSLMIVVEGLEEEVEFVTPENQYLEKGDRVRIVYGQFAGVEGVLQHNQGARQGGRVYVSLTDVLGLRTSIIPDEYLQVLSFARGTNHFYYKFQAVEQLLHDAMKTFSEERTPSPEQKAALNHFLFRYECLTGLTYANWAKYVACRYAALWLLHRRTEAEEYLSVYHEQIQSSKSARRAARRSPAAGQYIEEWVNRLSAL